MAKLITSEAGKTPQASMQEIPQGLAEHAVPLVRALLGVLDDAKAEDIITLDLAGKTSLADAMIIATGRSDRHVGAIAERIAGAIRDRKLPAPRIEGMPVCDWVLIDAGDVILHLFRPEVRGFYNLEKLWGMGRPLEGVPEEKPKPATKPKAPRTIKAESAADEGKPKRAPRRTATARPRAPRGA